MTHAISRTALIALNSNRPARISGAVRTSDTPLKPQEKT